MSLPSHVSLAIEVTSAMSEGVNCFCVLLEWNDGGAIGDPPIDGVRLFEAVRALESALHEVVHGAVHDLVRDGRMSPLEPPILDEDIARVAQIAALIPAWPSTGALPPELVRAGALCERRRAGAGSGEAEAAAPPQVRRNRRRGRRSGGSREDQGGFRGLSAVSVPSCVDPPTQTVPRPTGSGQQPARDDRSLSVAVLILRVGC